MHRQLNLLFVLTAAILLSSLSLQADTPRPISIDQLTTKSHLVLHGTVVSKSVQRDPENRIYTKIDLQVAEVWKGTLTTNHFTIIHGGGILGDERVDVSGQVEYEIGEEVVVFLLVNQRGEGVSIGMDQGKFHVSTDAKTGEKLVQNPFHGQSTATAGTAPASRSTRLKLLDLKQQVTGGTK